MGRLVGGWECELGLWKWIFMGGFEWYEVNLVEFELVYVEEVASSICLILAYFGRSWLLNVVLV